MAEFDGKTALITGAAGNLGRAVADAFAMRGAALVLADRLQDRLDAEESRIKEAFPEIDVMTVVADLSKADTVDAMFRDAATRFGQVDVIAHTVGGFSMGPTVADGDLDELRRMFELNVVPLFLTAGRGAQHMLDHGVQGSIIVVLARAALDGAAKQSAYRSSKAAAQRVMESLAAEVRDKGIRVNGIMPSTIDTPPNRDSMPNADFSKWVTPEQLAEAIVFLASPAASALYGVSLPVYNRA
jgi:NAD(P)-dependent dehydrogenase (short-subunit alcohol dehydrogenase family)